MLKSKKLSLIILILVMTLLLTAGTAVAEATVSEFSGNEYIVNLIYPGDVTVPGGKYHNFHGRGNIWELYHDTTDPRVTGTVIVHSNGNFNADFEGPAWGTFYLESDTYGGAWNARWHSPAGKPELIYAVGHGTGDFEGMKAKWTFEYVGDDVQISGRILEP
jgi:hypothetical protein